MEVVATSFMNFHAESTILQVKKFDSQQIFSKLVMFQFYVRNMNSKLGNSQKTQHHKMPNLKDTIQGLLSGEPNQVN